MPNNIYKAARNIAGITQERAAELLYISCDTLSNYERGIYEPDKEMVAKMIAIYGTPHLAMQYLFDSPLQKYIPECRIRDLPLAVINFLDKYKKLGAKKDEMLAVTADGKIEPHEEEFWEEVMEATVKLQQAAMELKYADRR